MTLTDMKDIPLKSHRRPNHAPGRAQLVDRPSRDKQRSFRSPEFRLPRALHRGKSRWEEGQGLPE